MDFRTTARGRFLLLCSVPALLSVISCEGDPGGGGSGAPEALAPEAFDLRLPADFFASDGRGLPSAPDITNCHTQGVVVAGDDLVVSCVLFDDAVPEQRTLGGKSYLLKAPLCDVVGCDGPPADTVRWVSEDITGLAPEGESQRITRLLLKKEELTPDELAIRHLMTHPSGLVYDPERKGIWVASAVYASDTYSELLLIRPEEIGQGDPAALVERAIPVSDHVGALSLIEGRYLVGASWSTRRFVMVDVEGEHEPVSVANPFLQGEHDIAIQDCDRWSADTMLCGGTFRYEARPETPDVPLTPEEAADPDLDTLFVRRGRLQQLRVDVARFPEVELEVVGYMQTDMLPERPSSIDFGITMIYRPASGAEEVVTTNDYDGYRTPLTLLNEAMGLDPVRQHVYFIPEDVPVGKLVRMAIQEP
jgi:hypothetical protein